MTTSFNIVRTGSIALIAFVLLALPFSAVHAADLFDSYDVYDYSQPDYSYDSYDVYDYSQPDYSYDSYDVYDYSQPDYGYNDYGGYSSGFMGSGSSYLPTSFLGGSSYIPPRTTAGNTQTQAQVSNNTNTNVNNNVITIGAQQTPVCANGYSGTYPNCYLPTPVCQSGYTGTYPNCYHQTYTQPPVYQNPPIAYNRTPYVALSAVPYTGLDLGFWGTVSYWGFLVLWCLVAAYLIVVKKVQNRILKSLSAFLFGDNTVSHTVVSAPVAAAPAPVAGLKQVDAIDDFILSQINRVRA